MKKYARFHVHVFDNPNLYDPVSRVLNLGESIRYWGFEYLYLQAGIPMEKLTDIYLNETKHYNGTDVVLPISTIAEGEASFLPYPQHIIPFFLSTVVGRREELRPEVISYLKAHEPIPCRDEYGRNMLRGYGIEAYLMGCYTIALPQRQKEPENGKVFLIDVSDELMAYIPEELKKDAVQITHSIPIDSTVATQEDDERINKMAAEYLERYAKEARLVITSRLHGASPCLALGIPVILASNNIDYRYSWIDKFIPIYTQDEFSEIDWNPKPADLGNVKMMVKDYVTKYLHGDPESCSVLKKLDEFYMDRERTDYYGYFRKRIRKVEKHFPEGNFRYIIWGAGYHGEYAHDLVEEMYPQAKLVALIDKFQKGERYGMNIVCGDDFNRTDFDFAFITTKPGTPEATKKLHELFGSDAEDKYVIITSQQLS